MFGELLDTPNIQVFHFKILIHPYLDIKQNLTTTWVETNKFILEHTILYYKLHEAGRS